MRRLLIVASTLACIYTAAWTSTAQAGFFPGNPIDDARVVGDIDLARDGTGAVAYIKTVGGVDHVFVSRFSGGVFQPPERVDGAFAGLSSQPAIAAAPGGRLVVVFVNGGFVHGVVRPAGTGFSGTTALGDGSDPSVDMSIHGTAMASFTSNAADVRVSRLDGTNNRWSTLPQVADFAATNAAGHGSGRSKIAISADGVAVVTWGEAGHVYARKVFGSGLSNAPQDLTPPSFAGKASTLSELPDIDAEEDSSYAWVVFRQVLSGGGARILARRQRGTTFDPPIGIDVGNEPGTEPRIEITPRGVGLAAMAGATSRQPMAATIDKRDMFSAGSRILLPSAVPSTPTAAMSDNDNGLVAGILGGLGQPPFVRVRPYLEGQPQPEVNLSRPELGAVAAGMGLQAAADRSDGFIVAWIQGGKLVAGYGDREPGNFVGYTRRKCCVAARAKLTWQRSFELWGPVRYEVYVDGKLAGTTTNVKMKLAKSLRGIRHKWQVIAKDVRGQFKRTKTRALIVDDLRPRQSVRFSRKGRRVNLVVRGRDPRRAGHRTSAMAGTVVSWGDGRKTSRRGRIARFRHRYRRSGKFTVKITTRDKAGNETVRRRTVRT
ncbi:MAG: hypothetical protein M3401_16765 [Actinomycetota bacterium]|nr:hypothetical protein [Actinomycetota bacterium]